MPGPGFTFTESERGMWVGGNLTGMGSGPHFIRDEHC